MSEPGPPLTEGQRRAARQEWSINYDPTRDRWYVELDLQPVQDMPALLDFEEAQSWGQGFIEQQTELYLGAWYAEHDDGERRRAALVDGTGEVAWIMANRADALEQAVLRVRALCLRYLDEGAVPVPAIVRAMGGWA